MQVASTGQPWDAGAFVGAVASGAATGAVAAVSIVVEPIDYALTAVQCVTAGCSVADVALTVVPGAIGPIARQVDNVLDIAKAAENTSDAVKAVENGSDAIHAAENTSDATKAVGGCSFSEDTLIATKEGEQAIVTLEVGDQVLAYHSVLDITGYYTVTAVWVHTDWVIEYLTIDGERITTTPEHPFYTEEYGWQRAGELWVGAHIRNSDDDYGTVQAIKLVFRSQPMYDLTVAQAHTFFVGKQQWLAHNAACPIIGKAQVTADPSHARRVRAEARRMQATGQYDKIYLHKELSTVTDDIVSSGKRPDIVGVTNRGTYDLVEVVSPRSQTVRDMQLKINEMARLLRNEGLRARGRVIK